MFRNELILEYHNGRLAAHRGRDQTVTALASDWWWPELRHDVKHWIAGCEVCAAAHGHAARSAWTRSNLYSHPFRALQFDLMSVPETDGYHYLLVVVCLFSRWCWILPLKDKTAVSIAKALLTEVFAPQMIFPAVLRSDNAAEFLSPIIEYVNQHLEIVHITGATYHPESQGTVERLNGKITEILRTMIDDDPKDWLVRLPFCVGVLRTMRMGVLQGRSPMEVVMGIQPQLPAMLKAGVPLMSQSPNGQISSLTSGAPMKRYRKSMPKLWLRARVRRKEATMYDCDQVTSWSEESLPPSDRMVPIGLSQRVTITCTGSNRP